MSWPFKKKKVIDLRKKVNDENIKTSLRQSEYINTQKESGSKEDSGNNFFNMFALNKDSGSKTDLRSEDSEITKNPYLNYHEDENFDEKKLQEIQKALQRISHRLTNINDRVELLERKIDKLERN